MRLPWYLLPSCLYLSKLNLFFVVKEPDFCNEFRCVRIRALHARYTSIGSACNR